MNRLWKVNGMEVEVRADHNGGNPRWIAFLPGPSNPKLMYEHAEIREGSTGSGTIGFHVAMIAERRSAFWRSFTLEQKVHESVAAFWHRTLATTWRELNAKAVVRYGENDCTLRKHVDNWLKDGRVDDWGVDPRGGNEVARDFIVQMIVAMLIWDDGEATNEETLERMSELVKQHGNWSVEQLLEMAAEQRRDEAARGEHGDDALAAMCRPVD